MLRFFRERKVRKALNDQGYFTVQQLSDEDLKNEMNDLMLQTASSGAVISACAQSHFNALDIETAEEALDGAVAIVRKLISAIKNQEDYSNISYFYATIYLAHAANNALLLDDDWREFYGAMKTCIDADVKKKHDVREGYA